MLKSRTLRTAALFAVVVSLAGCSAFDAVYPDKQSGQTEPVVKDHADDGVLTSLGNHLFGDDSQSKPVNNGSVSGNGIGINGYLWRATLDTLSFMPLTSADPFGGVIISDWYAPPETPNERFKVTVSISDRELRADAIHVSLFRQVRTDGGWADSTVNPKTKTDVENAILTRARELRSANTALKSN